MEGALRFLQDRSQVAVARACEYDQTVRPVYAPHSKTHKLQQVGSCVLVMLQGQYFAFSASHVFDAVGLAWLTIGCGDRLHVLQGDRFSTRAGPSGHHGDDPVDGSVYFFTGDVPQVVRDCAIGVGDLDIEVDERQPDVFTLMGFHANRSRSTGGGHVTRLEIYPTVEDGEQRYALEGRARDTHLLLAAEKQVWTDGKLQLGRSLKGFRGGAMYRVPGTLARWPLAGVHAEGVKLAAIIIEHRKGRREAPQAVAVGTRLGVYFALIAHFLPALALEEALNRELNDRQAARAAALSG